MKINYKTCNFIVIIVALLVVLTMARYLALENNKINKELQTTQNNLQTVQEELDTTKNELMSIQENLLVETEKSIGLSETLGKINKELEIANVTISDLKSAEYELVYLGDYKITYYCDERYDHVCGGNGMTASEKPTEVGVTAAADWSVLPSGSAVYINGVGWREIQDVGGSVKGNHIDVLVENHDEALNLGTDYEGVWLLMKKTS
jgi:3D (Asp-Asp-Asp) domain-containing protein